ncbi:exodeoxyribonuclease III [Gallaecimonas kandeliae]|uniref:exodeoxyribonuclease III n=1 Tax=Gallaecimonas kandeliae TaxID=3029055 RepID=UPI0026470251|nr:exodeoxyribonuclease III [Gallaecimonas kandeliae]WKE66860.1 exodeoxyribonuclease III [Gallaecimonas kandeliae]
MKIISFNINGLRARLHQLQALIDKHQPDIIGLQETKVHDDQFPLEEVQAMGYQVHFHGQKGHYGVALLSKLPPEAVEKGFPGDGEEAQKRMIIGRFQLPDGKPLTVMNGYFPQGENRSHELKFPAKEKFYADLMGYLEDKHQPEEALVIMGDMNISSTDLDIGIGEANAKRWLREGKCSFLPEEREWMDKLLAWGLVDTFRTLHPAEDQKFSWFDYRSKGFDDNRGLRIDLVLATQPLAAKAVEADIDYELRGIEKPSDHAPIWTTFEL